MLIIVLLFFFIVDCAVFFSLARPSNGVKIVAQPTHEMTDGAKVSANMKCIEAKRIAIFAIVKNANIAMRKRFFYLVFRPFFTKLRIKAYSLFIPRMNDF